MRVIVAGAGAGSESLFTPRFVQAIKDADIVIAAGRLASSLCTIEGAKDKIREFKVMQTVEYIKEHSEDDLLVCVAATGDTGFYSIASTIYRHVSGMVEIRFLPGISSMAYLCASIGKGYEHMKLISLHGKDGSIIPHVCYNELVFSLTGGSVSVKDILTQLIDAGLTYVKVNIGENLSLENERITSGIPQELISNEFDDLAVVIIENKNYMNNYRSLKDEEFIRGSVPMTKRAVRDLSVTQLEIKPTDVVYDIGAGTGSVTCALALKASENFVYAIEQKQEGVDLIKQNINALGTYNIKVIKDVAPAGMDEFPAPDKVFIGGSSGNLKEIVNRIINANRKAVILVTAVTLETLTEATAVFDEFKMAKEVSCINVSNAKKLGRYNLMFAENPVYLIKGEFSEE